MKIKKIISNLILDLLLLTLLIDISFINSFKTIHNIEQSTYITKTTLYNPNAVDELVIYMHESYLAWGINPESTRQIAFDDFGVANGVTVKIVEFSGMVDALNVLVSQKDNPQADVVIGLDSISITKAKNEGVLFPYSEVSLDNISTSLITALDPEKYLLPLDYGLIALVFDPEYISNTTYPEIDNLTFEHLLDPFGETLTVQDPTLSATGLNFLLYQIVFYEEILGKNWIEWWSTAKEFITIDKDWSDSWDRVFSTKEAHMLVSYGTDPAYNAYFNYSFIRNAAIIHNNTHQYGWLQIEGIGIVNGTDNLVLAKKYIDYSLSPTVQNLLATNNWMFPTNTQVSLPQCYDYAITTDNVTLLNSLVNSSYIGMHYQSWLNDWEQLIYGTGFWWLWVLVPSLSVILILGVGILIYHKKKKIDIN